MDEKNKVLIEKRNSEVFLRPRFTIDLEGSSTEFIEKFSNEFSKKDCAVLGEIKDAHIFIDVNAAESHFWSPQLQLEILEETEHTATLKGLFGPKPQVWTLFMFIHFVIGISFLAFGVFFYTRFSLGRSFFFPLVMLIVLPLVWLLLYFLGKIGKSTGHKQMNQLHEFMINTIAK